MKCPHCLIEIHATEDVGYLGNDCEGAWGTIKILCPACKRNVIYLIVADRIVNQQFGGYKVEGLKKSFLVYPKGAMRNASPKEVPLAFSNDYKEACLVVADSPKASAALSRRCLQHLLREMAGIKTGSLANEIQQVLDSKKLPSYIANAIDGIRNIGNFAAHPLKSESSGEVVDVEPGEADWNLDVIESLFDFYFVQPAVLKMKQDALDTKLSNIGKPNMNKNT